MLSGKYLLCVILLAAWQEGKSASIPLLNTGEGENDSVPALTTRDDDSVSVPILPAHEDENDSILLLPEDEDESGNIPMPPSQEEESDRVPLLLTGGSSGGSDEGLSLSLPAEEGEGTSVSELPTQENSASTIREDVSASVPVQPLKVGDHSAVGSVLKIPDELTWAKVREGVPPPLCAGHCAAPPAGPVCAFDATGTARTFATLCELEAVSCRESTYYAITSLGEC